MRRLEWVSIPLWWAPPEGSVCSGEPSMPGRTTWQVPPSAFRPQHRTGFQQPRIRAAAPTRPVGRRRRSKPCGTGDSISRGRLLASFLAARGRAGDGRFSVPMYLLMTIGLQLHLLRLLQGELFPQGRCSINSTVLVRLPNIGTFHFFCCPVATWVGESRAVHPDTAEAGRLCDVDWALGNSSGDSHASHRDCTACNNGAFCRFGSERFRCG